MMKKKAKKLYHLLGEVEGGSQEGVLALESCKSNHDDEDREASDEPDGFLALPVSSGTSMLPGAKLGQLSQVDEDHVTFEEFDDADDVDGVDAGRHGPAQVANEAYREGWTRAFGKN